MAYRDDRDAARYRIDALEEKNRELNHELTIERARRTQERRSVLPWILLGGVCASVVMGVAFSMATLVESSEGGGMSTHRTPDGTTLADPLGEEETHNSYVEPWDNILADALRGAPTPSHADGSDSESLPELPARNDVIRALNTEQVLDAIHACSPGEQGTTSVRITVEGSTGRVTEAVVTGQFTGTPVGACIAHVVRDVSLSRFSRASKCCIAIGTIECWPASPRFASASQAEHTAPTSADRYHWHREKLPSRHASAAHDEYVSKSSLTSQHRNTHCPTLPKPCLSSSCSSLAW